MRVMRQGSAAESLTPRFWRVPLSLNLYEHLKVWRNIYNVHLRDRLLGGRYPSAPFPVILCGRHALGKTGPFITPFWVQTHWNFMDDNFLLDLAGCNIILNWILSFSLVPVMRWEMQPFLRPCDNLHWAINNSNDTQASEITFLFLQDSM